MSLKFAKLSVVTLGMLAIYIPSANAQEETPDKDYTALTAEAADARKFDPIFKEAIDEGHFETILHLGQIGTAETCRRIDHHLGDPSPDVRLYAASAAAMCLDKASVPALVIQINRERQPIVKGALYRSLGLTGREDVRKFLIDAINENSTSEREMPVLGGAIEGLMQNIVYAGLAADQLPALDYTKLLKVASQNGSEETAFRAAYLLTRISKLDSKIAGSAIEKAFDNSRHESVKILLARVAARLGETGRDEAVAIGFFARLMGEDNDKYRYEAISGLGRLSGPQSESLLWGVAQDSDKAVLERQAAVSALLVRESTKAVDQTRLAAFLSDLEATDSAWLRAKALQGKLQLDAKTGEALAIDRLQNGEYYEAFQAIAGLSRTDSGKAKLTEYAAGSDNSVRAQEARIGVDPSIEADTKPRPTPPYEEAVESQGKITLTTSKGVIEIQTVIDAPYASYNFVTLVKEGKLDGMIWHRVIPNFVAQAGQKEDASLYEWGSIREEWAGGPHVVGSVGVATAGKDTGGTQFFINTHRNMHLNGRYTVFGQGSEGLDIAFLLEEGDIIEKATFEASKSDDK
jgi:cyclophilin family peptidyl-prolyl cis-trans isomerase/HEAT repeat protein